MSDSLEFRLLKYIVAVAETNNFTRAAERLFLAQPSLSKQIRDLESAIGFPIFARDRNGVRITPAGEMVLAYAKEALKARQELVAMAYAGHSVLEKPDLELLGGKVRFDGTGVCAVPVWSFQSGPYKYEVSGALGCYESTNPPPHGATGDLTVTAEGKGESTSWCY